MCCAVVVHPSRDWPPVAHGVLAHLAPVGPRFLDLRDVHDGVLGYDILRDYLRTFLLHVYLGHNLREGNLHTNLLAVDLRPDLRVVLDGVLVHDFLLVVYIHTYLFHVYLRPNLRYLLDG